MQAPDLRNVTRRTEKWFARHQRPLPWREAYDPYHVWLSEVMLQQTRMEVVLPYFERFLSRFPSISHLAAASDRDVTAAWSGLGYYRRARMLRDGALAVMERFGGTLPSTVEELLTIPGIGRYTAGAIASVAFERRAPIVDGNVTRVVARLFGSDGETWERAEALVHACARPRHFNQGLMELGALVCTPRNPSCLICPLRETCVARATNRVDELPAAKAKKATRELHIPLFLIVDRHGRVLMRREDGPLMHAMYHLPHGDASLLEAGPLDVARGALLGKIRHTVTTRKIEFSLYDSEPRGSVDGYEWIDPTTLATVPHPSYVAKALKLAAVAGSRLPVAAAATVRP
ncbi:MAG TPA: A/G-specific adenine glycosylase [Thermoanaerobaculia bacterium]